MFNMFDLNERAEGKDWHAMLIRNRMPYLSERPYDWAFIFEYVVRGSDRATVQADVDNVAHAFIAWAPPIIATRARTVRVEQNFETKEFVGVARIRGFFEGAKPEGYEPPKHARDLASYKDELPRVDEPVLFGLAKS